MLSFILIVLILYVTEWNQNNNSRWMLHLCAYWRLATVFSIIYTELYTFFYVEQTHNLFKLNYVVKRQYLV